MTWATPPDAGADQRPSDQQDSVGSPGHRVLLVEVLVVALIVVIILALLNLDPTLVRQWSNAGGPWRLFGGPTPS